MNRRVIYDTIRYPIRPSKKNFERFCSRIKKVGYIINHLIGKDNQETYTHIPSSIPYPQDKRYCRVINVIGNITKTKFILNWTLKGAEPFTYYVIVGKPDNAYIADRLLHYIYLVHKYQVEYEVSNFKRVKRNLRRRKKGIDKTNSRTFESNLSRRLLKDIKSILEKELSDFYQKPDLAEETDITRYIDGQFKIRLKNKPGPKSDSEPTLSQYYGKGVHQICNRWELS